jgi:hypothetical protein
MERFQKLKVNRRKLDVDTICRFCGMELYEKHKILEINDGDEIFSEKVFQMIGKRQI